MGKKLKRVSAPGRHNCEDVDFFSTLGFSAAGPGRQCCPIHDKDTGNAQVASQAISFQVSAPAIHHGAGHQYACLKDFLLEMLPISAKRECDFPGACASSKAFTQESPRRRARARTRHTTTPRTSASWPMIHCSASSGDTTIVQSQQKYFQNNLQLSSFSAVQQALHTMILRQQHVSSVPSWPSSSPCEAAVCLPWKIRLKAGH